MFWRFLCTCILITGYLSIDIFLLYVQELYLSTVKYQCFNSDPSPRECSLLLHKLEYAEILAIMMTKVSFYRRDVTFN